MAFDMLREFASYPPMLQKLRAFRPALTPRRIAYGAHKAQYLLHYAPPGEARLPVVLYLHGGGWNSGTPTMVAFIGEHFARAGYHCVMPGYRLSPANRFPAQREDVLAAYACALRALEEAVGDAGRIAVGGSSAGGHLGALLCYDTATQQRWHMDVGRLCGFAGLGGVYKVQNTGGLTLRTMLRMLFAKGQDRAEGEPLSLLQSTPRIPMLLVHGRGDPVVPYEGAAAFAARAAELDVPCELYTVPPPGDTHSVYSAASFLETRAQSPVMDILFAWLESLPTD